MRERANDVLLVIHRVAATLGIVELKTVTQDEKYLGEHFAALDVPRGIIRGFRASPTERSALRGDGAFMAASGCHAFRVEGVDRRVADLLVALLLQDLPHRWGSAGGSGLHEPAERVGGVGRSEHFRVSQDGVVSTDGQRGGEDALTRRQLQPVVERPFGVLLSL
ncbi:hypothetical protein DBP15_05315 [Streptomyces sp. CS065A]|nr:hypothetical protein DBP15_05315 [Streptomyces sp. CS065A]